MRTWVLHLLVNSLVPSSCVWLGQAQRGFVASCKRHVVLLVEARVGACVLSYFQIAPPWKRFWCLGASSKGSLEPLVSQQASRQWAVNVATDLQCSPSHGVHLLCPARSCATHCRATLLSELPGSLRFGSTQVAPFLFLFHMFTV
ncbi:hypothetical protein COO60DRAFT_1545995, partial [Scenedesmus sp. NREL 46B-D3]